MVAASDTRPNSPTPDESTELVVYGAAECCLCDEAMAQLRPLTAQLGLRLRYVDIAGDEQLEAAHRTEIPVGYLHGRKVFKYRVDEDLLRRRVLAPPRR